MNRKWTSRWIAIGATTLGILTIFFTANSEKIGLFDLIPTLILSVIVGVVMVCAIEALLERFSRADAPRFLAENLIIGAIFILVLLLLGAARLFEISGIIPLILIGVAGTAILYAWRRDREIHKPICFVQIENDGNVISVKQGEPLLDAMEAAGYKVLKHCNATGDCATCRVNIRETEQQFGSSNYGPVLTPRQQNEGWVIACRVPVEQDMVIRLYKPLVIRWPGFDRQTYTDRARELRHALPGFDCEACGYNTCDEYAVAIANRSEDPAKCHPGGAAVREKLSGLLNGVGSAGSDNA